MENNTKTIKASNKEVKKEEKVMADVKVNNKEEKNMNKGTDVKEVKKEVKVKIDTLAICDETLKGIKEITYTHNARNMTISNNKTGKKCFEVWKRSNAIRLYIPQYLLNPIKEIKNSGIYNITSGVNGYPKGTYSIYVPALNIKDVLPALVKSSLTIQEAQVKAKKEVKAKKAEKKDVEVTK